MTTHTIDTEAVFQAYVDCALWSCSVEEEYAAANDMAPDVSLQSAGFGPDDIASEALDAMRTDVMDLLADADAVSADTRAALAFWVTEHGEAAIGHDFWLTRNGHGAGFWDRWSGETDGERYGRILTDMAKPYGESHLYVCDDGVVYVA